MKNEFDQNNNFPGAKRARAIPPRWADCEDDAGFVYTAEEVREILSDTGFVLPHLKEAREPLVVPDAVPEEEEQEDELADHGLRIGRALNGRRGLPKRLQVPVAFAAEEERRIPWSGMSSPRLPTSSESQQ